MKLNKFKLYLLQAEQGLTGAELAKKAGMSRQTFSTVRQRGTCTPITAGKIARALGVPIEALMMNEEDPKCSKEKSFPT